MPVPPALPPGYGEALYWAQRYNRSYTRHSHLYQAFGPIPSHSHAPREAVSEPTRGAETSVTAVWMMIVVMVFGAWLGSTLTPTVVRQPSPPETVVRQPLPPETAYTVLGSPSVSAAFIDRVLAYYHSPAQGRGQALYDLGVKYGVDPVFALAFFMNESTFGTQGEATKTLALGNERCITDRSCVDQDRGGYAQFDSWEDGFEHWYMLITGPLYKGDGRTTVATIIPRYAPNSDHNNEQHYIWVVEYAVDTWRAGKVVVA